MEYSSIYWADGFRVFPYSSSSNIEDYPAFQKLFADPVLNGKILNREEYHTVL